VPYSSRDRLQDIPVICPSTGHHRNRLVAERRDLLPERGSGLDGHEDNHQGHVSEEDRECCQPDRDAQSL
jgi:hypothetical protein